MTQLGEYQVSNLPERESLPVAEMPTGKPVLMGTEYPLYDTAQIGLEPRNTSGSDFKVVGDFLLHDGVEEPELAVVCEDSDKGVKTLWLVGVVRDEQGKPRPGGWVNIEPGVDYTVGRGETELSPTVAKIGGKELIGKGFSDGISRKGLTLSTGGKNILATNFSTNGIGLRGESYLVPETSNSLPPPDPETAEDIGEVILPKAVAQGLIDKVPQAGEDMKDWQQAAAEGREKAIAAAKEGELAPLQQRLDALLAGLNEDDKSHLKYFGQAEVGQRLAQRENRAKAAKDDEERKGWHLQRLTPAGRQVVWQYAEVMKLIDRVNHPEDYK